MYNFAGKQTTTAKNQQEQEKAEADLQTAEMSQLSHRIHYVFSEK